MSPELERLRKELEIAVNDPNMDMKKITEISCKLDEKIAELYLNQENEGIDYDKNYKKFLEREDKEELIYQISQDLKERFNLNNMSKIDINRIANYIYDFCCLTVHNVQNGDIAHFVARKGWYCYDLLPEEEGKESLTSDKKYEEIVRDIQDKYIKILKK